MTIQRGNWALGRTITVGDTFTVSIVWTGMLFVRAPSHPNGGYHAPGVEFKFEWGLRVVMLKEIFQSLLVED